MIHAVRNRNPARRRAGLRQSVEGVGPEHTGDRNHSAQQGDSIYDRTFFDFRQLGKVRHVSLRAAQRSYVPVSVNGV